MQSTQLAYSPFYFPQYSRTGHGAQTLAIGKVTWISRPWDFDYFELVLVSLVTCYGDQCCRI